MTNAGNRLAFYRVPGKSAILMESNIRCPPLRELTDWLSVFLPGRFDDVTEYARYDNEYTRERAAFSVNIKKHTPLRKLMAAYCSRLGSHPAYIRFSVDGKRITPDDPAEKLGLEDEGLIVAELMFT